MGWQDRKVNISWKSVEFREDSDALKRAIIGGLQMQGFIVTDIYNDPNGAAFQVHIKNKQKGKQKNA